MLARAAALGDDDDLPQAAVGGNHLGQDDVGPADAEAHAHGPNKSAAGRCPSSTRRSDLPAAAPRV